MIGESFKAVDDFVLFVSMVGHETVDVDDKILIGAILRVVVVESLNVCVFVPVALKKELLIVCSPDLVKSIIRPNDMSSWNTHGEKIRCRIGAKIRVYFVTD